LDLPVVATDFDLRDTPEDKLPYDPKNIGAANPQSPLELKPEPKAPTPPDRKSPRAATERLQQEPAVGVDDNSKESLNLRG
jgi:hypothetical protein